MKHFHKLNKIFNFSVEIYIYFFNLDDKIQISQVVYKINLIVEGISIFSFLIQIFLHL